MSPREQRYVPHYTQGPQGNMVADYRADFEAMYGGKVPDVEILGSGVPDIRDNRDPSEIGAALLAEREATRKADRALKNGS